MKLATNRNTSTSTRPLMKATSILSLCYLFAGCAALDLPHYEADWSSLDTRPLPPWYDAAKVGIFLHWGVYSVPSFGSEWFWQNWKGIQVKEYENFMQTNYKPGFSYQEFGNEFSAELFNATQWALLLEDSGAKYVVLTSKHHDGYTLWPSKVSFGWNAMDVGPKRDIIEELSSAVRNRTLLKFGLYYSLYEWFNREYLADKGTKFEQRNYVNRKARLEQIELVEKYLPEVIWSDGDWEAPTTYWASEEFIAWLYNDSPVRDTVVTNDRWGKGTACLHGDFYNCADRYNPGVLKKHKWENAFTLDKRSWGQRFDVTLADIMSSQELIAQIVTTVSCNGNALVNVGPTKYGTILPIYEERLRDMGAWLRTNGEAIYNTHPWIYQNDTKTPGVWYTLRTKTPSSYCVYAIILEYPYDTNSIVIYPFQRQDEGSMTITLLGMEETSIKWTMDDLALHVDFPPKNLIDKRNLRLAWTFRMCVQ